MNVILPCRNRKRFLRFSSVSRVTCLFATLRKDEQSENLQDNSGFLVLQHRQVVVAALRPDVQRTEGIALRNSCCILYQSVSEMRYRSM